MDTFIGFFDKLVNTYLMWFVKGSGIVTLAFGLVNWQRHRHDEDKAMKFVGVIVTGCIIFGCAYIIQFIYNSVGGQDLEIL